MTRQSRRDQPGTLTVGIQAEHTRDRGIRDGPGHSGRLGCQVQRGTGRRPFDKVPVRARTHLEGQRVLILPGQAYLTGLGELANRGGRRRGSPGPLGAHPFTVPHRNPARELRLPRRIVGCPCPWPPCTAPRQVVLPDEPSVKGDSCSVTGHAASRPAVTRLRVMGQQGHACYRLVVSHIAAQDPGGVRYFLPPGGELSEQWRSRHPDRCRPCCPWAVVSAPRLHGRRDT
jgi:hypothetical protein